MASSHAFAYKGNIISPPANVSVQGVGVKGGVLTDDGTGVWRSADGLVSFTPALSVLGSSAGIDAVALILSGNQAFFHIQISSASLAAQSNPIQFGAMAGIPNPIGRGQAYGSSNIRGGIFYVSYTGVLVGGGFDALSNGVLRCTITFSVPASGSVNPADSKSMLVDNDNAALGSIFSKLVYDILPAPSDTTVSGLLAILDAMVFASTVRISLRVRSIGLSTSYNGSAWCILEAKMGAKGANGSQSIFWDLSAVVFYSEDTTFPVGTRLFGTRSAGANPVWYKAALTAI